MNQDLDTRIESVELAYSKNKKKGPLKGEASSSSQIPQAKNEMKTRQLTKEEERIERTKKEEKFDKDL